jgi:putative DNA primase/helicase
MAIGTGSAPAPHVPRELTQLPQWVGWLAVLGEGKQVKLPNGKLSPQALKKQDKQHKLPINPRTGGLADTTNSSTWGEFRQAVDAKRRFGLTGVGFVFTEDDPYVGVDIDNCREPATGEIEPWAREIIRELNSYTEVSPFKFGVKIWIRAAKIPKGGGNQAKYETGKVEMFSRARYFACTGVHVDETPLTIEDRREEFLALHARIFGRRDGHSAPKAQPKAREFSIDDQELLRRARQAKNGAQFNLLWDGKWKEAVYPSQSEADLALCCILAFWTDRDPTRMDRLFRSSGLMREKWDRDDYHMRTINRAIERTPDTYRPRTETQPAAKVQATATT